MGLDHYLTSNAEQQGLKKYKNQLSEHQVILNEYTFTGTQLIQVRPPFKNQEKVLILDQSRAKYFQLLLEFKGNFAIEDPSFRYTSLQLRTSMCVMLAHKCLNLDEP